MTSPVNGGSIPRCFQHFDANMDQMDLDEENVIPAKRRRAGLGEEKTPQDIQFQAGWDREQSLRYEAAISFYKCAAELGHTEAELRLGFLYEQGRGINKNCFEAAKWYERAAKKNNREAQYYLGRLYEYGTGIHQDLRKAFRLYQQSSENGFIPAREIIITA